MIKEMEQLVYQRVIVQGPTEELEGLKMITTRT